MEGGPAAAVEVLWRGRTAMLTARSLGLAVTVTLACLVVGGSAAWLVARTDLPGRTAWQVVLALPLAVPSYVAAFSWVALRPSMSGFGAAALVLTATSYPYVYLPVLAALRRTDPALEEVARSLGRGRLRSALSVTLPQLRPALASGGLLVVLYVLSDFGAVSILRFDTFTRVVYTSYRASFDRTPAAVLSLLLVAVTVLVVAAEARSRGRSSYARLGAGAARRAAPLRLGPLTALATAWLGGVALVALGVPAWSLGRWLVLGSRTGIDAGELGSAAAATLWVSLLGALLTTALALPVGVLAARRDGRLVRVLEQASYAGHALPGIVVALSLVFLGVNVLTPLYQELPLLVLAYAVLFLPLAVAAVRASVVQSPVRLEEVARSLGRSPAGVLRSVTLPLAGPGVAAGALLVLLTCMKELPATLLLRPTGMDTLATELWSATTVGAFGAAAPAAALLVLLAALPTFLLGTGRELQAEQTP